MIPFTIYSDVALFLLNSKAINVTNLKVYTVRYLLHKCYNNTPLENL